MNFCSYILYAVFFALSVFWSRQYEKSKNISLKKKMLFCILIASPIFILQGFRYGVGTDYFSYLNLYKGFNNGNELFISWYHTEPFFIILCKIAYFILNGNNIGYFIIDAILMNVILFLTFDYYIDEISLPLMYFFYYMFCLPYFFNVERQGLAVVIVWYATKYVHEKKFFRFLCCILAATLFHNTAIVGVTFYFFNIQRKNERYIKKIIIISLIFAPFVLKQALVIVSESMILFEKYKKFLKTDINRVGDASNANFMYMVIMILILLLFTKILKKSKINIFWVSILCIAQLLCYLLSEYIDWGFRMSFYFEFGIMYAYSFICVKLQNCVNKIVFLSFIICSLLFYFTYKFYIQGNGEIFPYQFIWSYK